MEGGLGHRRDGAPTMAPQTDFGSFDHLDFVDDPCEDHK